MPLQRIAFTPHPVWGKTDEQMYAYLEGNDPVSGNNLMKEVIDNLTRPLTADESKRGQLSLLQSERQPSSINHRTRRALLDNGMTDFMPVVPTQGKWTRC